MNDEEPRKSKGREEEGRAGRDPAYRGKDCLLDIKMDYVRNQIKNASFETDSERIYHLMRMERWAIKGPTSYVEGLWWHHNKKSIMADKDYRAIKSEVEPGWERKEAERLEEERRENEEEKRREKEEEER